MQLLPRLFAAIGLARGRRAIEFALVLSQPLPLDKEYDLPIAGRCCLHSENTLPAHQRRHIDRALLDGCARPVGGHGETPGRPNRETNRSISHHFSLSPRLRDVCRELCRPKSVKTLGCSLRGAAVIIDRWNCVGAEGNQPAERVETRSWPEVLIPIANGWRSRRAANRIITTTCSDCARWSPISAKSTPPFGDSRTGWRLTCRARRRRWRSG